MKKSVLILIALFLASIAVFVLNADDTERQVLKEVHRLLKQKAYDQALSTALKTDRNSGESSPYISLFIFEIFIEKNEIKNAYIWLGKTIERGFRGYDYFLDKKFKILHKDYRFMGLMGAMKKNAGIGKPLTDFSLPQFSGSEYSVAGDRGKVILLDFWATWCPPCVAEYPNLINMYETHKERGLQIVSISADFKREVLAAFLKQHPIPWINGFSGKGNKDNVVELFNIESFPTYVLIDRKGIVRHMLSKGGDFLNTKVSRLLEGDHP